jgi:hypothetical protein
MRKLPDTSNRFVRTNRFVYQRRCVYQPAYAGPLAFNYSASLRRRTSTEQAAWRMMRSATDPSTNRFTP